jgi:hypothetical protein
MSTVVVVVVGIVIFVGWLALELSFIAKAWL